MDKKIKTYSFFELLPVEEYAKRLHVGRTTIFKWKESGKLVPQQHFIQKGRMVRFIWELETIRSLHDKDTPNSDSKNLESDYMTEKKKDSTKKSPINFNY
jgi:hypothetical protein